ncbi:hypothetical protein DPMN_080646 [Dreissena polymorpha]|uniref:Uncharacterized protein n=1 Tax=Dreissena polymorpha TaxID=45954 RepID=A0A9D3YR95_DREPO|nr:hypothetical protein DPMN_080646 [Dreissena polymorpha]
MQAKSGQSISKIRQMISKGAALNHEVIKESQHSLPIETPKNQVHYPGIGRGGIAESKSNLTYWNRPYLVTNAVFIRSSSAMFTCQ